MSKPITITVKDKRRGLMNEPGKDFEVVGLKNSCEHKIGDTISEEEFRRINRRPAITIIVK